jgi:DNA-binding winged helix-turn-helix (wHTH) protein/TolB-like protein/Flp pilus assembly protein TadD
MSSKTGRLYKFRDFRLDAENPSLWLGDRLVPLPPKALEMLILLVSRHEAVVSREELLETVWRDTFVEEGNINYTVSLLRKTLGENDREQTQFIQTVPKRGYRFVADVREVPPAASGETVEPPPAAQVSEPSPRVSEPPAEVSPPAAQVSALAAEVSPPAATVPVSPPAAQVRRHMSGFVLLGAVLLTSAAVWWGAAGRRGNPGVPAGERNIRTVAILPLKTLTDGGESRALSLGLTDSLISRLGSLKRFTVRPLTSVRRYSEADTDPLRFGEELKADAVLEGTLQMADNRLRVNVRLWDVRDGAQLWQGSFDETETDFFKLQDALSVRVTQSLVSQVLEKDRDLVTRRETQNREAYYAYWRGRFFLEKRNPEKATPEFEQAISLDPGYALAYTGLSNAYTWRANFTSVADAEFYEQARALATRALELDPTLSDAYTSLARVQYSHDWDWAGAEKSFRRALEFDPNNVDAHQFYARLLATLGRYTEGLAEINKARELDPRSADLGVPLFAILEKRGEFDEALRVLHASLEMDGESQIARRAVGKIHLLKGEYGKVIELAGELIPNPAEPDFAWASMLATAYHRAGQAEQAAAMQRHLEKLAEKDSKALYFLAMHDGELGRTDEAVAALEKCLELREERMIWTKDEPRFAALKGDPRFRGILRKMNLVN